MPRKAYPSFDPALRIAILTPDLSVRQISRRIRRSRAIAGSVPLLRHLAESVESGRLALPAVEAAVVALTGVAHGDLTGLERDLFWRTFQVPVFEHFVAPDGRIVATECDAHDGLHLLHEDAPLTGFCALLDTTPCGCGNSQPRLFGIARIYRPSVAAPIISAAVTAHIDDHSDYDEEQVHADRRVA